MMTTNKTVSESSGSIAEGKALGLYLHIPFCVQKCNYCDFLSFGGSDQKDQADYIEALINEIKYYGKIYRNIYYVDTIFIGGGTPSLIESSLIAKLVSAIKENFQIDENAEFTIESNPKTLTREKLKTYIDSGINRLSIGAQSLDERLLHFMGRVHSKEDILSNFKLARECGFQNINLDLMFAVPEQTKETWANTLEKAMEMGPEHISFYSLQIEEETPFFQMFREGRLKETSDELDRAMYHGALSQLENRGYLHYEISNAAKAGYQCRHNLRYWSLEDYLGLGLGAHSYLDGIRFSNVKDLREYVVVSKNGSVEWSHINSREENISEYLFTGMRKMQGISLDDFRRRFGMNLESLYGDILEKYQEQKLIKIMDGNLRFTKNGIDISNRVLAEFV